MLTCKSCMAYEFTISVDSIRGVLVIYVQSSIQSDNYSVSNQIV